MTRSVSLMLIVFPMLALPVGCGPGNTDPDASLAPEVRKAEHQRQMLEGIRKDPLDQPEPSVENATK